MIGTKLNYSGMKICNHVTVCKQCALYHLEIRSPTNYWHTNRI